MARLDKDTTLMAKRGSAVIKDIVKDVNILSQKSKFATKEDLYIVDDLIDTANAHSDRCVGIASVQIGYHKRIVLVKNDNGWLVMINPIIVKKGTNKYEAMENCLSFDEPKKAIRYNKIEVIFNDRNFKTKKQIFNGFKAQIVQHEIDHCDGILV